MRVTKETEGAKVQAFIVLDTSIEVDHIRSLLNSAQGDPAWTTDMRQFIRDMKAAL